MNDYWKHETTRNNSGTDGGLIDTLAFIIWIAIAFCCPLLGLLIMTIVGISD